MSVFFVDTSALAKRYVLETGSTWVRSWILPRAGHTIVISALATVEIASFVMRRERENSISVLRRTRAINSFLLQVDRQYVVVELEKPVLQTAKDLILKHPLRSLDAVQLACALQSVDMLDVRPTFISADTRLLTAAAAEGLPTDNPNAHP